jgi:hypothetical protein
MFWGFLGNVQVFENDFLGISDLFAEIPSPRTDM